MSAHYAMCKYDDATWSYIPLASREEEILAAEEAGTRMLNRALAAEKQRDSFRDAAEYNKRRAEDAERQRDNLLKQIESIAFRIANKEYGHAALACEEVIANYPHGSLGEAVDSEGGEL